jgi:uncharacterized DUF497 family protein
MIFEWDKTKDTENVEKHGVDFDTACRVFLDPDYLIREDVKHSIDEQ